jgi:cell division protein FtsB
MGMIAPAPDSRANGKTRRAVRPVGRLPSRRRDNPWVRRAVVFATCVLLADAIVGDRGLAQTLRARHDYAQAAAALASLRQENARLRERARRLQDDPAAIEAAARETLGLIRPGEILVVVKDLR